MKHHLSTASRRRKRKSEENTGDEEAKSWHAMAPTKKGDIEKEKWIATGEKPWAKALSMAKLPQ